jgi:hypothetical protein
LRQSYMDHDQVTVDGVRLSPISARASCFLTQRLPDILPPHGKSSGCGAAISTEICFVFSIFPSALCCCSQVLKFKPMFKFQHSLSMPGSGNYNGSGIYNALMHLPDLCICLMACETSDCCACRLIITLQGPQASSRPRRRFGSSGSVHSG